MLTLGLTGGIASGKSTVSAEFKRLGAVIIDADQIARALTRPHMPLWGKIIGHFGKEIQKDDLTIDRFKLGQRVFTRTTERAALNKIMHPEIKREIERRRREIEREDPGAVVIVDAALLIETGTFREVDRVIVCSTSEKNQTKRLVHRDGLTVEEARSRIRAQMALKEKLRDADYVVNTDGSLKEIRTQVKTIYRELEAISGGGHRRDPLPHRGTTND